MNEFLFPAKKYQLFEEKRINYFFPPKTNQFYSYTNTLTGTVKQEQVMMSIGRPELAREEPIPIELDKQINRYTAAAAIEEAIKKAQTKVPGHLYRDCPLTRCRTTTEPRNNCKRSSRSSRTRRQRRTLRLGLTVKI